MSDFMPVPSPSPEPSPKPSSKPEEHKGFWGHVADVADFLFATKSLGRILTGEGGWGDLAAVGITAASFFIPPVKLLKYGAKPLESIVAHAAEVAASDTASVAAKRAAERTAENARYLLENPDKHQELVRLANNTDNPEIIKLNNLNAEADHFISTGTVPEPLVRKVSELSKGEIEPSIANEIDRFKTEPQEVVVKTDRTIATPKGVAERFGKVSGSTDESKNVTRGLLEEEDAPKDLLQSSVVEKDRVDYPFLSQEDIAQYRIDGRSEEYIANMNRLEESLGASRTAGPRNDNPYAEKYPHVHPDVIAKLLTGSVDERTGLRIPPATEKKLKALNEAGKRAGYTAPTETRTAEALTAAEENKLHTVQAEMPVTAEGKPITRRMEDSIPEDLMTDNPDVNRAAWLLSESKKLENFLKKKPANAGEIRATKNLWTNEANKLQIEMDAEERQAANELADQLTERSLADYKAGKATVKRGVVNFNIDKETDVAKLTDARDQLIKDWRAETDPDLKKAIAFTGKKVSAKIAALTAGGVATDALINPANADTADGSPVVPNPSPGIKPVASKEDEFLNTTSEKDLSNAKKYLKTIKYNNGDPDTYVITSKDIKYLPLLSNKEIEEWMLQTNSNVSHLPEKAFEKYVYNEVPYVSVINDILKINGKKLLSSENFGKLTDPRFGDKMEHYDPKTKKIYITNIQRNYPIGMDITGHELGHLLNDFLLNSGGKDPIKNKQDASFNYGSWAKYKGKIQPAQIEEMRAQLWEGTLRRLSGKYAKEYGQYLTDGRMNLNINIWDPTTDDPDKRNFGLTRFLNRHGNPDQSNAATVLAYNDPTAWLDYLGVKYPAEWKTKFPPLSKNAPAISKLPEGYQEVSTLRAAGEGLLTVGKTILKDIFGDWS